MDKRIEILIIRYLTNDVDEAGLQELNAWLGQEENRSYFNKIKAAWILSGANKESIKADAEDSWKELLERISIGRGSYTGTIKQADRAWRRMARFAAVFVLAFAAGALSVYLLDRREAALFPNSIPELSETIIEAPLGSRNKIILPDSSEVWLNAGSTLHYPRDFGPDNRKLRLTGEAFFSVKSNAQRPFIVEANKVSVRALGTKFNVKAYPEEEYVTAILQEGKIDVVIADLKHDKITLNPNEKIVIHKQAYEISEGREKEPAAITPPAIRKEERLLVKSKVNAGLSTSWKDKQWKVTDESVESLVPVLGRRYGREIIIRDRELNNYIFTGTIENESIEHILEALRQTAPLDYTIHKDSIVLSLNQANKAKFAPILRNRK